MKLAVVLGIGGALFLHAAFLAFGGLLLPEARADHGTTREVSVRVSRAGAQPLQGVAGAQKRLVGPPEVAEIE